MQVGDLVRILVGGSWVSTRVVAIEPRSTWNGCSMDGWIDAVVLRFESGRRLRFKRGIIEESSRFHVQGRLV